MANRMYVDQLVRLTLVRKGATAKHPALRKDVVEAVKAQVTEENDQNAEHEGQESQEGQESAETGEIGWYSAFEAFLPLFDPSTSPDGVEAAFEGIYAEKASAGAKKPNYPASRGPFAGPHNSFPIKTQQDVYDAARLIGHAQNPAAVKSRIIAIARSKGFSLPKSWQSKTEKSANVKDLLDMARQLVARLESAEETPAEETPPAGEETEKARVAQVSHSHSHQHTSQMGYGYSHTHGHPHPSANMQDHDTSETAHAHEHVAKSAEDGTVNIDEIAANQTGLHADLVALKARVEELVSALEAQKTAHTEATEALKAQVAEAVEKAKQADEKLASVEDASRRPLTAPTNQPAQPIAKDTPFDVAFSRLLHS